MLFILLEVVPNSRNLPPRPVTVFTFTSHENMSVNGADSGVVFSFLLVL
jgi:hypothetical protein